MWTCQVLYDSFADSAVFEIYEACAVQQLNLCDLLINTGNFERQMGE